MQTHKFINLFSVLLILSGATAHAVLIQTNDVVTGAPAGIEGESGFIASATDLVNQGELTFSSLTSADYSPFGSSGPISNFNDGSSGTGALSTVVLSLSPYTVTFTLDTTVNVDGYDITSIESLAGWSTQRADQRYSLSYSLVGSGSFISLGTFSLDGGLVSGGISSRIALTDSTGVIASGVDQLQFSIQSPGFSAGDETVYREIDVFGAATVPEPGASELVIAMGMAFVLLKFRRLAGDRRPSFSN